MVSVKSCGWLWEGDGGFSKLYGRAQERAREPLVGRGDLHV